MGILFVTGYRRGEEMIIFPKNCWLSEYIINRSLSLNNLYDNTFCNIKSWT